MNTFAYITSPYFYIFNVIVLSVLILLERKRPEKTIAWIMIFVIFPPLGIILYIFLGRNWKKYKLKEEMSPHIKDLITRVIGRVDRDEYYSLITLLARNSESPLFVDNDITLFRDGTEKFETLKKELLKAKHHIHLEYYIVKHDNIGNEIKNILIKKASEGVKIRFIIDKVGSGSLSRRYKNDLKKAGIEVVEYSYFLAPLLRFINTQINYRNHRKIVVIDGTVGFLGGNNVGDEYLGKGELGYWRDSHIMIQGDFVLGLQGVFLDDYFTIKKANEEELLYESEFEKYFPKPKKAKNQIIQLVKSGPNSEFPSIMHAMLKMINMAEEHINIITPYFVPPEPIIEALKVAALSGIDVKILFPGQYDHFIVYFASRSYLAELIKCGVKVYLYNPKAFVHAKVISVDGKISTLGTANIDMRSFDLNYEINAVIYDDDLTEEIDNMFIEDLKYSKELTLEEYEKTPIVIKFLEAFTRLFSSLL
ncbi:cardiolipin synthase [Clostridium cylindrosporum]|uniref:Cardiolipin synthase n=1 Tax=Clostridium cylindrosporum DSM 605 TaxID=1121307 RepID=A0A0J8DCT1_CLOCY|nr:cardiolipin synthase [Clostridium cylindrosporum]KMT22058.1 cardiolipin synthase Cls [Clostridium cylindrosporum DSM 605]